MKSLLSQNEIVKRNSVRDNIYRLRVIFLWCTRKKKRWFLLLHFNLCLHKYFVNANDFVFLWLSVTGIFACVYCTCQTNYFSNFVLFVQQLWICIGIHFVKIQLAKKCIIIFVAHFQCTLTKRLTISWCDRRAW